MAKTMKNKDLNPLDNLFRQGLNDAESGPPSASWAQMEALLDAQPKQKRKAAAWWWAAAAAIIPLFLAGIWWITKPQGADPQMAEVKPKTVERMVEPIGTSTTKSDESNSQARVESKALLASSSPKNHIASKIQKSAVKKSPEAVNHSIVDNSVLANAEENPETNQVEPPSPPSNESNLAITETPDSKYDNTIASIEYKTGKPNDNLEGEVASIEFKPNHAKRPTLSEQFNKFRNGEINLPTIGDAKQNLFALLSHK